jgi:hypothetical protein
MRWLPGPVGQLWRGDVGNRLRPADGVLELLHRTLPRRRAEHILQRKPAVATTTPPRANVCPQPFTPPPTNQSSFHQWTVGAMYYSALAVAEALGRSNTSQVQDTLVNYGNPQTPAYAIYENGAPARVAAFNYMDDGGNGTATSTLSIVLPSAPAQVTVK